MKSMSSEEIEYRGYILTVVFLSPQWQVGIFPSQPELPRLPAGEPPASGPTHDQALVRARLRVDDLMDKAKKA
jgi:hypothetical protein